MSQKEIGFPEKTVECIEAFEVFMRRKPKKMRNAYWRAWVESWRQAMECKK